jgi:DNA helicase HerA-like ATPase
MPGVDLAINMRKLAQRSAGLFGQSGTGKSYLARMVLAGIIRDGVAAALIFDMHSEYGWQGGSEHGHRVKGLKQLFPQEVAIFTMDDESSRLRGSNPDYTVIIGRNEVDAEDIEAMGSILQLSEPQIGAVYTMARVLGVNWLTKFLDDQFIEGYGADSEKALLNGVSGLKALAQDLEQPYATMAALRRRFERFRAYGFLQDKGNGDAVDRLFKTLDAGRSVVLEFGKYGNSLDAYMFVSNFLTRRIRARYEQRMNAAFGGKAKEPTPLMIVIEEAHKFDLEAHRVVLHRQGDQGLVEETAPERGPLLYDDQVVG